MTSNPRARTRTVPIFINRRKYEVEPCPMTGREILAVAGLGDGYDLLLLNGEGDPTGGELILADQVVEIRPGLHFRAIPGNRTFGLAIPDDAGEALLHAAKDLEQATGNDVTVTLVGTQVLVTVHRVALPHGVYSAAATDVLLVTDRQYPGSSVDMFWMEPPITLADGSIPPHASSLETYAGREWRRWSWHRNGLWTPGVDDLVSHWAFIEACWAQEAA